MFNKKLIVYSLVLSFVGLLAGYVLTNSIKFGICLVDLVVTDASCINFYERLGNALFYGMSALSLVFFVLLFVPEAFGAWKKFAIWFVPAATLLFIAYKTPGSGDFLSPYPEDVFRWVSYVYVIVSLVIIFINRKKT